MLPASIVDSLPDADFRAAIAHEFAHMRRNDFAKNLSYQALSLPVSYHPLLRLTRERITESREMVCDRMAAEFTGRTRYAHSLLRLASLLVTGTPAKASHAIGIFDANTLERRLMKLTEKQSNLGAVRQAVLIAACAVVGVATCGSALALGMHVDAASNSLAPSGPVRPLKVSGGVMAGNNLSKVMPKYPEAAKKAKIQGAVVLNALISKDGNVENLQAVSGPEELRASAIEAVRQWTYKPFLLNGNPVEVNTTVTVTYSLQR